MFACLPGWYDFRLMKKILLSVAVLAASLAVLVPSGTATTEPSVQINVKVTVTDTAITMSRYRARRGWGAHFIITNTGRKPHTVDIGGLVSKVIKPGGKATVSASLDERGKYPFSVKLNASGPGHRGVFVVY